MPAPERRPVLTERTRKKAIRLPRTVEDYGLRDNEGREVGKDMPQLRALGGRVQRDAEVAAYRKQRGWRCKLYSAQGSTFIRDLGFEDEEGKAQPGVSILVKKQGAVRVVKQVNVMRDKHCPSVLEVFWMLPGVKTSDVAWAK
jgi:hypothetical protein